MRRLAILRIIRWTNAAPPEMVLTKMSVPSWARLVRIRTRDSTWPEYTEFMFEADNGCFYLTPDDCLPPQLFVDRVTGEIDWHSCDGDNFHNGSHTCPNNRE